MLKPDNCQQFLENIRVPVFWFDRLGRVIFANSAATNVFGYSEQELLKLVFVDIDATLSADMWNEFFNSIVNGDCKHSETFCNRRNGSRFSARMEYSLARQGAKV